MIHFEKSWVRILQKNFKIFTLVVFFFFFYFKNLRFKSLQYSCKISFQKNPIQFFSLNFLQWPIKPSAKITKSIGQRRKKSAWSIVTKKVRVKKKCNENCLWENWIRIASLDNRRVLFILSGAVVWINRSKSTQNSKIAEALPQISQISQKVSSDFEEAEIDRWSHQAHFSFD